MAHIRADFRIVRPQTEFGAFGLSSDFGLQFWMRTLQHIPGFLTDRARKFHTKFSDNIHNMSLIDVIVDLMDNNIIWHLLTFLRNYLFKCLQILNILRYQRTYTQQIENLLLHQFKGQIIKAMKEKRTWFYRLMLSFRRSVVNYYYSTISHLLFKFIFIFLKKWNI